jgi:F0F1-type ATP synthase assembly protein I
MQSNPLSFSLAMTSLPTGFGLVIFLILGLRIGLLIGARRALLVQATLSCPLKKMQVFHKLYSF